MWGGRPGLEPLTLPIPPQVPQPTLAGRPSPVEGPLPHTGRAELRLGQAWGARVLAFWDSWSDRAGPWPGFLCILAVWPWP